MLEDKEERRYEIKSKEKQNFNLTNFASQYENLTQQKQNLNRDIKVSNEKYSSSLKTYLKDNLVDRKLQKEYQLLSQILRYKPSLTFEGGIFRSKSGAFKLFSKENIINSKLVVLEDR